MKMIKEICKKSGKCTIRTRQYSSTLAYFQRLFDVARKDFPKLTPESVTIVHYAGNTHKYTFGIEFDPIGKVPADYDEITDSELIL